MQLNPVQEKAITHFDSDICLSSGAGCGKTTVLCEKYLKALKKGLSPHEIVAITFTDKAASEMKGRILKRTTLGEGSLFITTIHGFCRNLLRRHGIYIGLNPLFEVIDEPTALSYQNEIIEKRRQDVIRDILEELFSFSNETSRPAEPGQEEVPTTPGTQVTGTTVTSTPPNPEYTPILPAGNDIASLADAIVKTVKANCKDSVKGIGVISIRNAECIDSLIGIINTSAINELRFTNSEKEWIYLQCVACARAMSKAQNKPFNKSAGYAKLFVNLSEDGYRYFPNTLENAKNHLVPGSLGIYTGGTAGHIYYITEVYRDETTGNVHSFRAFECNYGTSGSVRHDVIRTLNNGLSGWQKPI